MDNQMKWFFIILLMVFGVVWLSAQEWKRLYEESKFREAKEQLAQLERSGTRSCNLYFNLGLCHFRLEEYPWAILYFEKALKWEPNCQDCIEMKTAAIKKSGLNGFDVQEQHLWKRYWQMILWTSPLIWFGLAMVSLSASLWMFMKWRSDQKTEGRMLMSGLMLVSLIFLSFSWQGNRMMQRVDEFILIQEGPLFLSPDENSPQLIFCKAGMKLTNLQVLGPWRKIRTSELDEGWIRQNDMVPIDR